MRDGRIVGIPARHGAPVLVLLHLISLFPAGRIPGARDERDAEHRLEDWAFWRRAPEEYGCLGQSAGRNWLPTEVPERTANMRQQTPA